MMYEKKVKLLRYCAEADCTECAVAGCPGPRKLLKDAADTVEDLRKKVDEWQEEACKWNNEYYHLLDNMPRWIPVTENNHPKSHEPVMVVYIGWNDALPHRDCTAYWSGDEGLWRWAETNDKVKVSVTHYMPLPPLPELPKEEE